MFISDERSDKIGKNIVKIFAIELRNFLYGGHHLDMKMKNKRDDKLINVVMFLQV